MPTSSIPTRRRMTANPQPAHPHDERAVERYAAQLLNGRSAPEVLAELADRIQAHPDVDGCCGNGCNAAGWWLPFPCPTRLFYEAVRDYLSSHAAPAPTSSARPPQKVIGTPASSPP